MKASNRYTLEHFDNDLRSVMWRVGVQGEKVCFIFDESNVLSPAFLERYVHTIWASAVLHPVPADHSTLPLPVLPKKASSYSHGPSDLNASSE